MYHWIFQYVEDRIELTKLKTLDKGVVLAGFATYMVLTLVSLVLVVIFISFGAAFYVGNLLDSYMLGFAAVSGFYLLVAILLLIFKKAIINRVANFLIGFINK